MKCPQKSKRFGKNINANNKDELSKSIEKRNNKNKTKYVPLNNSNEKNNNNINHIKKKDNIKIISNEKSKNKSVSERENCFEELTNIIKNSKYLSDRLSYLQLWWKTIFQIIKIQRYLRGFLYRIKLLRLLELNEKIVYGTIQLSKVIKSLIYHNFINSLKNEFIPKQQKKHYFLIWNNYTKNKSLLQELKKYKINEKNKFIKANKLKSDSKTKRELSKELKKDALFSEKVLITEQNIKKISPNKKLLDELATSSKKNTFSEKINYNSLKNNSMERKKTKKNMDSNLSSLISKNNLKEEKSHKKPCQCFKTSNNFLKNKSQQQMRNYKFCSKNHLIYKSNQIKVSKKNTNVQKCKKLNKIRNKKLKSGDFDNYLNKFKSYCVESSNNKFKNNLANKKKNSELEYISKHENRFHCPKQLYYLNKNNKKKSSLKYEKLDISTDEINNKREKEAKNEEIICSHLRARSMEGRGKKKFKSFIQNVNNKNKLIKDDSCLNRNHIKRNDNNNVNQSLILSNKENEQRPAIKSKTKIDENVKTNKKSKKNIDKNRHKAEKNIKDKLDSGWLDLWRDKNLKRKIVDKLRSISILMNFIKKYSYKKNGNILFQSLQKIQKYEQLSAFFNIYRNKIYYKMILQKLKENKIEENNNIKNNIKNKDKKNSNDKKNNIIEISPYINTRINDKIKNNYIKSEINKKLKKLIIIKQKLIEYSIIRKYFLKWKVLTEQYKPDLKTRIRKIKEFYLNLKKNSGKENERINSSYHKKRVKYQKNINMEFSYNENNNKLYNKKIVNYNNNIIINNGDYLNKSQPKINNYDNLDDISIVKEEYFNNTLSQTNNYNNLTNFNHYNHFGAQQKHRYSNLNTASGYDEHNNINININLITKGPVQQGIYKRKKVNNYKDINNSVFLRDVNKSNFELNNTLDTNNEFNNNSMIMGHRKNNNVNEIYYPKHISPNKMMEIENEPEHDMQKAYVPEQPELYNKNKNENNNMAYKKINVRYQKMYYDNDLNSEYKQNNCGILEEQTNEATD